MAKHVELNRDNTKLSEYGLTYDRIMEGERAELEAEGKIQRKEKYVKQDTVNIIVAAYADDLLNAYEHIEELELVVGDKNEQLLEAKDAFDKSQNQVKMVLNGADNMQEVEEAMEMLDKQMIQISNANNRSQEEVLQLKQELEERSRTLEAERDRIDAMRQDVAEVLENLESYLNEEGIVME